jgi:hypothetical protein
MAKARTPRQTSPATSREDASVNSRDTVSSRPAETSSPTSRENSTVTSIDRKVTTEPRDAKKSSGHKGNVEEEIRRRAYELFEHRGKQHGYEQEDWARAEAEVLARYANRTA